MLQTIFVYKVFSEFKQIGIYVMGSYVMDISKYSE